MDGSSRWLSRKNFANCILLFRQAAHFLQLGNGLFSSRETYSPKLPQATPSSLFSEPLFTRAWGAIDIPPTSPMNSYQQKKDEMKCSSLAALDTSGVTDRDYRRFVARSLLLSARSLISTGAAKMGLVLLISPQDRLGTRLNEGNSKRLNPTRR